MENANILVIINFGSLVLSILWFCKEKKNIGPSTKEVILNISLILRQCLPHPSFYIKGLSRLFSITVIGYIYIYIYNYSLFLAEAWGFTPVDVFFKKKKNVKFFHFSVFPPPSLSSRCLPPSIHLAVVVIQLVVCRSRRSVCCPLFSSFKFRSFSPHKWSSFLLF